MSRVRFTLPVENTPRKRVLKIRKTVNGKVNTRNIEKALGRSDYERLKPLIYPGSSLLRLCFPRGETVFHYACGILDINHKILHDLLRIGVNINAQNKNGFTPLHIALIREISQFRTFRQSFHVVRPDKSCPRTFRNTKFLIQNGANLDIRNKYNNSPVDRAVRSGYLAAVEIFVNEDVPLNVENRCLYLIKCLLNQQYYTLTSRRSLMLLKFSIINDDFPSFKYILNITKEGLARRNKIKTYKRIGNSALCFATLKRKSIYIKVLMDEGFDPEASNSTGMCAIEVALQAFNRDYNIESLKYLLDCGLSANFRFKWTNVTILRYACETGNLKAVKLLLNRGAKLETKNFTTLHHAVLGENPSIVALLLEQGLSVNYGCDVCEYRTPLKFAVYDFYDNNDKHRGILNIFLAHAAKMIASKKYLSEENRELLKHERIKEIYRMYEEELTKMKERNISPELNVSFLDILTKDIDYVGSILKQVDVKLVINEAKYQCEFPKFSEDLKNRIEEAIFRRKLVELGNHIIFKYTKKNIPFEIALVIFKNLTINDLTNFVVSE